MRERHESALAGEVDALVVKTPSGDAIYTLTGADRPYRAFVESMREGALTLDDAGVVLYANRAFAAFVGQPLESILGINVQRFFSPPLELTGSGRERPQERELTAQGRGIPVSVSLERVQLDDRRGFNTAVVRDLSQDRLVQRLRESEARFRLMANQTPINMWVTDTQGAIEFVNDAYCAYFAVTPDRARGASWQSLVHPDDGAYVNSFFEALRARSEFHASCRVRRSDGEWRWIESRAQPRFAEDGECLGMIGVSPDVTDARRASELERNASRQKDEFIAVLAHELRNPLAPIRTSVAVLRALDAADPAMMKCRDIIDRQVTQMARLLDDLLDVSRLSQGKLTLRRKGVKLGDIVEQAVEAVRSLLEERGHEIFVELLDPSLELEADQARLVQVLTNLLNNAAIYTEPRGKIQLSVEKSDGAAVLRIRDSGIGLRAEMRERIFDLFTQVEDARRRADGGLGIGLALTKRLVEMHGGTICAESEGPGLGSTFVVTLPLPTHSLRSGPLGPEPVSHAELAAMRRRVLVVDDNVDAAESLALLLETIGCDTRTAHDGESALRTARSFLPQLVLLDLGMPRMDGETVCRRLREESWGRGAVIAAVTGWGQDQHRRQTRMAGFDHHLVKPIDLAAIEQLVGALPTSPAPR